MNIRNLGRKESVGIKFKKGIYAKLCLKPWFESDWYFGNILVILLSQDGFESTVVQKCNFFLQITGGTEVQLFSTKHYFFCQYCDFFLQITTFFYNITAFFYKLQLFFYKPHFFFYNMATFFYKS